MLVDASYLEWVRPARRVHLALSVGMTVTGVILATFGIIGSRTAGPVTPPLNRTAGSSIVGGGGGGGGGPDVAPLVPPLVTPAIAPPSLTAPSRPRLPIVIAPVPRLPRR